MRFGDEKERADDGIWCVVRETGENFDFDFAKGVLGCNWWGFENFDFDFAKVVLVVNGGALKFHGQPYLFRSK